MRPPTQILIVEDTPSDFDVIQRSFAESSGTDWQLANVETLDEAILACQSYAAISPDAHTFDAVILDLGLPDSTGLETLTQFRAAVPDAPVVVLAGLDSEEMALQAIAAGAQDYWVKGNILPQRLPSMLRFAIARQQTLVNLQQRVDKSAQELAMLQAEHRFEMSFIGLLARELRDLFNGIQLAVELLHEWLDLKFGLELVGLTLQPLIIHTEQLVSQVMELLDDVVWWHHLRSWPQSEMAATCNVSQLGQSIIEQLRPQLSPNQRLFWQAIGDVTAMPLATELVQSIISQLVENAITYSPAGGDIHLQVQLDVGQLLMTVSDHGLGIPMPDQMDVWVGLYRGSNVRAMPGTGMGLTIVQRCVELLQGNVSLMSEVGRGTTVVVTLPILTGPPTAPTSRYTHH